jgi:peptidoglycan/LPS O-acetylase OafA/YrhL
VWLDKGSSPAVVSGDAKKSRIFQLDFLRGVAILLVLLRHPIVDPHDSGWLWPVAGVLYHLGWTGVDLFFVLSGFLVGGLLFDELRKTATLNVRRFIIRRGFKIWPPYFVYLFVILLLLVARDPAHNPTEAARQLLPNFLHAQNYLGSPRPHTWSLAVEEHFYLLLPFLVIAVLPARQQRAKSIPRLPIVALSVAAFCLAFRVFVNRGQPFTEPTHYFATHVRADSMFFGVLLSYLYHYGFLKLEWVAHRRTLILGAGLLLISPMSWFGLSHPFSWTIGYTLLYLGYGAILLSVLSTQIVPGKLGRLMASPPARLLAWVGFYSYSVYLWHLDFAPGLSRWLLEHLQISKLGPELTYSLGVVLYLPLAVTIGVGLARLIEGPSLRLRDKLFPSRARGFSIDQSAQPMASVEPVASAERP